MSSPILNIVVPLYNEELVFNKLIDRLTTLLDNSHESIEVIMVDDGSKDNTANLMLDLSMKDARFHSIILSRNFGHQTALTAGLSYVNASEGVMVIDGDLQDPPELIHTFYKEFQKGHDVIYAIRKKRKEGPLKRFLYSTFYRILRKISYIDIPLDTGDFSFISRRVVDQMNDMPEESRYLRGMRSWIGYSQIGIEYERSERADGDSKYPFSKLLKLALNGIFNFSEFPVKAITNSGFAVIFFSIMYIFYTLIQKFIFNSVPEGFTTLVVLISLFGGAQLVAIGLIGEYIMRIFFQVKGRPLFVVKNSVIGKVKKNG
jgi:polyisoprenyl-phosphate glycosyltransferase